jgi:hypothetical protein
LQSPAKSPIYQAGIISHFAFGYSLFCSHSAFRCFAQAIYSLGQLGRFFAFFASADADGAFDLKDEEFAVADFAGFGGANHCLGDAVDELIGENDFYFDLGQKSTMYSLPR